MFKDSMKKLLKKIAEYKVKDCKNLLCTIIQLIIFHKLIRLGFFILLSIIGLTYLEYFGDNIVFESIGWVGLIGCVLTGGVWIIFGLIINPIKYLVKRLKK